MEDLTRRPVREAFLGPSIYDGWAGPDAGVVSSPAGAMVRTTRRRRDFIKPKQQILELSGKVYVSVGETGGSS